MHSLPTLHFALYIVQNLFQIGPIFRAPDIHLTRYNCPFLQYRAVFLHHKDSWLRHPIFIPAPFRDGYIQQSLLLEVLREYVLRINDRFASIPSALKHCSKMNFRLGRHSDRYAFGAGNSRFEAVESGEVSPAEGTPVATVI